MPTMTHTPAERKEWHSGKKVGWETIYEWWRRVTRGDIRRGAYTHPRLKRGVFYKPEDPALRWGGGQKYRRGGLS